MGKKQYNFKYFKDVEIIPGFNVYESALLRENGINTVEEYQEKIVDQTTVYETKIREFLWGHCYLKGVEKFKEILEQFKNKKVCILGDYDADGIMGTTILKLTLEKLGYSVFHVIPDRLLDGFAVKTQHIDKAIEGGAELIITVDNGTSAIEPIQYAKEKGLTVIITDHHLPDGESLPAADLIINPHVNKDEFEDICGAVVAMKISAYLLKEAGVEERGFYETIFDFGAIATVADMMPVVGENRLIIKLGLQSINKIKEKNLFNRIGKILAGMSNANYMNILNADKIITEETLAYYICPVLNATGRIEGDVNHIVDDLIACGEEKKYLFGYREKNKERKLRTKEISEKHVPTDDPVDITVLKAEDFKYPINGLIGLLANRISNGENKPCFVGYIPKDENICKLSGRTVNGYSIYDAFQKIKETNPELQIVGGGHDGAVGIEMPIESIETFKKLICEDYLASNSQEHENIYVIEESDVDAIVAAHEKFQPYGEGFDKLKFIIRGKIESKIEAVNMVQVGSFEFKLYTLLENIPPVGTEVDVCFSISFGNMMFAEFKIETIEAVNACA